MKMILIVDDVEDICYILSTFLRSLHYSVKTASSKDEMFQQLEETTPHLVILDVRLGGDNGAELCKQLKEQRTDFPIILTSASNEFLDYYRLYLADEIIEKPFELSTVEKVVRKVLSHDGINKL